MIEIVERASSDVEILDNNEVIDDVIVECENNITDAVEVTESEIKDE